MAPKSVTFRRHDHLVSVLFGDLLSHSYNITFSMFLYLVYVSLCIKLLRHLMMHALTCLSGSYVDAIAVESDSLCLEVNDRN